jgi:hypothetical protein
MEKMKVHKLYIICFLLGILAVSCGNDPIFFVISTETAPIPPRIEGAPTNMAVFTREYSDPNDPDSKQEIPLLFVASGRLHWYRTQDINGNPKLEWDNKTYRIPQPGGKIISLAVTTDRLYALSLNGDSVNTTLRYIGHGDNKWTRVSGISQYPLIQSIYADPETNRLFAGARQKNSGVNFALLYLGLDDNNTPTTLKMLRPQTSMLTGAVCRDDTHYLCTNGDGIFQVTETELANDIPSIEQLGYSTVDENRENNLSFMGMIKLEDGMIIAVQRSGGILYEVQDGAFSQMYYTNSNTTISTGRYATGALALWKDEARGMMKLVAGIQGGLYSTSTLSYTNGYVEFDLIYPTGAFDKASSRRDSNRLQTVNDTDRYTTSLGKHPINHLFQTPQDIDKNMTFFASTQTAGLWSYRDRPNNGGPQWNAEE